MPNATPKKKIVILGDSTIDNRVWLGLEKYILFTKGIPVIGTILSAILRFISWCIPTRFKAKSVVENLRSQMPGVDFIDSSNDGFTTQDIVLGAPRDTAFGTDVHRFFPHENFKPLKTPEIPSADHIILSIGGNDFRMFIRDPGTEVIRSKNGRHTRVHGDSEQGFKDHYDSVFKRMTENYKKILKKIASKNPTAKLVLMTQYYPDLIDKPPTNVYQFMDKLGQINHTGNAQDTIVDVVTKLYTDILKHITTDETLKEMQISVVDVSSSLNPNFTENFVMQIEPSAQGGKRIAEMLAHTINDSNSDDNKAKQKIYRFGPEFSASNPKQVYATELNADFVFKPVHPKNMPKPKNAKTPAEIEHVYSFNPPLPAPTADVPQSTNPAGTSGTQNNRANIEPMIEPTRRMGCTT